MRSTSAAVYVVDDDASPREAIVGLVEAAGFRARGFASASEFLAYRRPEEPSCLVLDAAMPEVSGLDLQRTLNAASDAVPIIFVSGHADVPMSVRALRAGAADFLTKPFDPSGLLTAIRRVLASSAGQRHRAHAAQPYVEQELPGIVGASAPLRQAVQHVRAVAPTDATVLIQGETGTGKECVARAVHRLSKRAEGPFITVNCAAIPPNLLESELMGHERGAFTGAVSRRIGRFELAQGGTIFLDEIGELPMDMQSKLLRVLQEREFQRLGGTHTLRCDARVVAATNRDLKAMAASRAFRSDLYYRLSVFPIVVPPLRERADDLPLLAYHFMGELAERLGKRVRTISPQSLDRLLQYDWPGNIRELQNVLERAVIVAQGDTLEVPALCARRAPPLPVSGGHSDDTQNDRRAEGGWSTGSQAFDAVGKAHILRVLNECDWVIAGPHGAAAKLRMKRTTLNFRMKKLGIVRPR